MHVYVEITIFIKSLMPLEARTGDFNWMVFSRH